MISSSSKKLVIAVTGLEGRDNPYPGPAIARALRAARGDDVILVGLTYEPTLTGCLRADLFDDIYISPLPGDPAAVLMHRLFEIHEKQPIDLLIPALDSELAIFARHKDELAQRGIRTFIPSAESVMARYKQRLWTWARKHGLHSPRTEVVTDPRTFWQQQEWDFPCFLKGSLADAVKVSCQEEAEVVYHRLVARWGYPILAQQMVHGEEFDICAVADAAGEPVAMIPIRKTVLSTAGKAIGAEVVHSPEALAEGRRILKALKWQGPLEIELMREHSSGRFFLIEVNARFPAWIGICGHTGVNLPDLLVRLALGEALPEEREPVVGTAFLRSSRTTLSRLEDLGTLMAAGHLQHRDQSCD
ncbi:MAG: ATP-grasp domain-containing protein [Planctomycetes bacterium]|nr:ATP-grasp domain-containing protein [Planctomycetota bacterium]